MPFSPFRSFFTQFLFSPLVPLQSPSAPFSPLQHHLVPTTNKVGPGCAHIAERSREKMLHALAVDCMATPKEAPHVRACSPQKAGATPERTDWLRARFLVDPKKQSRRVSRSISFRWSNTTSAAGPCQRGAFFRAVWRELARFWVNSFETYGCLGGVCVACPQLVTQKDAFAALMRKLLPSKGTYRQWLKQLFQKESGRP